MLLVLPGAAACCCCCLGLTGLATGTARWLLLRAVKAGTRELPRLLQLLPLTLLTGLPAGLLSGPLLLWLPALTCLTLFAKTLWRLL